MKGWARFALIAGLGVVIALIARTGAGAVMGLLARAGWVLLWLVPLQLLPLLLDVAGWRLLIPAQIRRSTLLVIAWIRQAINRLLPVANVGGDIVGVHLLMQAGVDGSAATASVILDLMVGLIAQYLFVVVGVVFLLAHLDDARAELALAAGASACSLPLVLMVLVLRHGRAFVRLTQVAKRIFGRWLDDRHLDRGHRLEAAVQGIIAVPLRVLRALAWQFAGFILGCSETWLALRWLGRAVSVTDALVLESLTQGARSLLFMVPAGLGVQEAGLVGVGHFLGLPPDAALALSLAKRMREVVLGVPALAAWQWIEGRKAVKDLRGRGR